MRIFKSLIAGLSDVSRAEMASALANLTSSKDCRETLVRTQSHSYLHQILQLVLRVLSIALHKKEDVNVCMYVCTCIIGQSIVCRVVNRPINHFRLQYSSSMHTGFRYVCVYECGYKVPVYVCVYLYVLYVYVCA